MACLGQCNLMTIEDIIRFLPDSSKIEDFSEEICACLEESNRRVDQLKFEMQKATQTSELIHKDIQKLQQRVRFFSSSFYFFIFYFFSFLFFLFFSVFSFLFCFFSF